MVELNMIQELPGVLADAFRTNMLPGENVVASLAGAMGEALVVTNRRVVVLREKSSRDGVDVISHPLSEVTGAATSASVTGLACSGCGASVSERDAFCASCGAQIKDVCLVCNGGMPLGSAYCPNCGSEARAASMNCSACGARANSAVMSHCPSCGTTLSPRCVVCGGGIVPGWERCRFCGREIGSFEGISPRALRNAQRAQEAAQRPQKTTEQAEEPAESPAAKHNAKGAELFNEERFEEAIEEFRRAVMLEPDNASFHCNLAVAYEETEQEEDARREYERTLELDPEEKTALLYLGYLLNENEDPERATELWRRLMEVAPGSPEAEEAAQNLRGIERI